MRRFKRGLALLFAVVCLLSAGACQHRTLEDAVSWEDAADICLGGNDMVICRIEGEPGEQMLMITVADISDSKKFIKNCAELTTCLATQSAGLNDWPELLGIVINMFDGGSENYVGALCIYDMPGEKYDMGIASVFLNMKKTPKAEEIRSAYSMEPIFSQIDGPTNYGWEEK